MALSKNRATLHSKCIERVVRMTQACKAELCPMWGGDECLCAVFGLDPDNPPRNGTFTVTAPLDRDD